MKKGSAGGKVMAIRQRQKAIKKYYENPNRCLFCNKIIEIGNKKVGIIKRKKFCNRKCSAKYNNKKRESYKSLIGIREKTYFVKIKEKFSLCIVCNTKFKQKRYKCGTFCRTKFCPECKKKQNVNKLTKKELFKKRKIRQDARNDIQKKARQTYQASNKPKKCVVCGYERHYEVSHIKDVKDFLDNSLIEEINHINNLIALCPTHHWEFDEGYIDKEILLKNNKT